MNDIWYLCTRDSSIEKNEPYFADKVIASYLPHSTWRKNNFPNLRIKYEILQITICLFQCRGNIFWFNRSINV